MVPCRKCVSCIKARKRSWIGRLNAEQETSKATWFTTFTYAGGYDNDEAYWLDYSHLQRMFKRMRRAGLRFRYVAVGEYGGERSRAHWHVMFFWQSDPPEVSAMNERVEDFEFWDKGYVQFELPRSGQACASYIMDYLDKDNLLNCELKFSKNPCLGHSYLMQYAREHARNGLSLFVNGDRFTIPNNLNSKGELFYYAVGRQTKVFEDMLRAYFNEWALLRPDERVPLTEDSEEFLIEICQQVEDETLVLQHYISRQYGYQPSSELPVAEVNTVVLADGIEVFLGPNIVARFCNDRSEVLWQSVLLQGVPVESRVLSESVLNLVQRARDGDSRLRGLLEKLVYNDFIEVRAGDHMSALPFSSQARRSLKPLSAKEPPPIRGPESATEKFLREWNEANPSVR